MYIIYGMIGMWYENTQNILVISYLSTAVI